MGMKAILRKPSLLAGLIVLFAAPSAAFAQRINSIKGAAPITTVTLEGVVRDKDERPLAAAEVVVDNQHRTITNSRGEFSISDIEAGLIQFTARRIGYNPVTTAVQVDPGLRVSLAVKLTPLAIQLGTIVVEGKRLDKGLWQTGFYKRRDAGAGTFFDSDYMSHFHAGLSSLMSSIPSVKMNRLNNRSIPVGKLPDGNECVLNVFVDGVRFPFIDNSGIDEIANAEDVLAVEVYPRASETPIRISGLGGQNGQGTIGTLNIQRPGTFEMGSTNGECGAVLIWTKPLKTKSK